VRRIAPQQSRIAVQQKQAINFMGMAAMRWKRRFVERLQLPFENQLVPQQSTLLGRSSHLFSTRSGEDVCRILQCNNADSNERPKRLVVGVDLALTSPASKLNARAFAALKKRRPPVGGRSLGRKRPRRACTANTVRAIVWRQIRQMQDLSTDFELYVPPCDVFATAQQPRVFGPKPILWSNQ
jgi:hypothetical protein